MKPSQPGAALAQTEATPNDDLLAQARAHETKSVLLGEKINDLKLALAGVLATAVLAMGSTGAYLNTSLNATRAEVQSLQKQLKSTQESLDAETRTLETARADHDKTSRALASTKTEYKAATARHEKALRNVPSCDTKKRIPYVAPARSKALPSFPPANTGCDPHDPMCGDLGV